MNSQPFLPFALPDIGDDEIAEVIDTLKSGWLTTGPKTKRFEAEFREFLGDQCLHCLAVNSATAGLHLALEALGIGPGDEVIVSPRSYVASAMCVVLAGATPVFADVDPESGCVTPATAEAVRSDRTRAVIPVHIGGWPCDMPGFVRWAHPHGIHILEDCAQSHGGHIGGRALGTFGIFASWSFCQDKIMTTGGEGGMLCTGDPALFKRCWSYTQHGKDHDDALATHSPTVPGSFRWVVRHEGTNLRMTEMQAAIGIRQLAKLPEWSAARRRNSLIMQDALRGIPGIRVPETPEGHAHYRCVAFTDGNDAAGMRDRLLQALHASGIPAMHGSCSEIYREQAFVDRGMTPGAMGRGALDSDGRLPNARRLGDTSLTFLVHHTIGEAAMRAYAAAARGCIERAIARGPSGVIEPAMAARPA